MDTISPSDRDALRVQTAAVAAQQAALDEEEARLYQRRHDLERQEEQLAAHLDGQRRALEEREAQLHSVTDRLAAERAEFEGRRKHFDTERQRWEQEQEAERAARADAARRLADDQKRLNTERELHGRDLRDQLSALEAARTRWQRRRRREAVALRSRRLALAEREQGLRQGRAALAREVAQWRGEREALTRELHGLHERVANQRGKLPGQAPAVPFHTTVGETPAEWGPRFDALDRLADELADQRVRLAGQWERLVAVERDWFIAHDQAAGDLETVALGLNEREEQVRRREGHVADREHAAQERLGELAPAWQAVQLWRGRLQARERHAEQESQQFLTLLRQREASVDEQLAGLDALRQEWQRARRDEQERLDAERTERERRQHDLARLQAEWSERLEALATPATSAVEVLRTLGLARDNLKAERFALAAEHEAGTRAEARRESTLVDVQSRERDLDHRAALLEVGRTCLDHERRQVEADRRKAETRLAALQAELDDMVRILLDEGEPDVLRLGRAA